jgi:hypothetical protein
MTNLTKDIISELKSFIKGSTMDALIPPILFMIMQNLFTLSVAALVAIGSAGILFLYRLFKKEKWQYAIIGFVGVAIASGFAYIAGNAKNYFLPDIIGAIFTFSISLISVVAKKPLAAWVSHLTRGWTIDWFWRKDIKPAYQEVTLFWTFFFFLRLVILISVFTSGNTLILFVSNFILGFPTTILILTISYIYGIWRLKTLKGPGIDEYNDNKEPPWHGQRKGF